MSRLIKKKKEEIGMSPDGFHFKGKRRSDSVMMRIIDYNPDHLNEKELKNINETITYDHSNSTTWLNIDGLHDVDLMKQISEILDLDSLIVSDVMDTYSRPKVYEYDNCIYTSMKMLQYNEEKDEISTENLVIIIKENILITFQERKGDVFEPVRERIRKNRVRIRKSGTDYLAFALIDTVFDNYTYLISRIGEYIEVLDEKLTSLSEASLLEEINHYKGEIIYLRKTINPCRDLILTLSKMESALLSEEIAVHLKELQDNINHAYDSLESYREILSDQLNIYHTTVSSKLNDIMKFLTVFSVVFIPLTFLAGIYGTNFDNIPELHYKYSYFIMWGIMIVMALSMIYYFKRKKWF